MTITTYSNRKYASSDVVPFKGLCGEYSRFLYVYKITCIPTQQVYIGQHAASVKVDDPLVESYKGSGKILKQLQKQYQWEQNFIFEIIQFCHDSVELDREERQLIKEARAQYGELCINIANGGLYFGAGNDGQMDDDYRVKMKHYRSSAEYRQAQSQRMKARNADSKFNYIKENNSKLMKELWANNQAFQQKMKIAAKNSSKRQKEKFKNNPHLRDKVGAKHSRPLTNINEFTSPLNGQFFPEGTIFPSTMQCSLMIGAKHRRYVSSIIANHKKHPMQWWSKKDGKPFFVVEFAYIDILETKS